MKYFEFNDYIIGVSSKCDDSLCKAIEAYYCLIDDVECMPNILKGDFENRFAMNVGYSQEELNEIEEDSSGEKIVLIELKRCNNYGVYGNSI